MELSLINERLSYAENVFSETHTTEETMEMIVPDAMPDILRIISADAVVLLRSKDTSTERVTVSGAATVSVIYAPEGETGLRRVRLEIPFQITGGGHRITPLSRATVRLIPGAVNAMALNPRKVSVRINVAADISCYNDTELIIPSSIAAAELQNIEVLPGETEVSLPVEVLEKTFVASYEYQIPQTNPPVGEILKTTVSLTPGEYKVVGSKLIFKGLTTVSVLYSSADGGEVAACSYETEYSQLLELENANTGSEFEIIPLLTGAYIESDTLSDSDGRRLSAELHIVAQCVARCSKRFGFISDAYSSRYELETIQSALSLAGTPVSFCVPAVLRTTLEAPELSRIITVTAKPGLPTGGFTDGKLSLSTPVDVEALYVTNDGAIRSATVGSVVEASADIAVGTELKISARCSGEVYGAAADGGIEVRAPIELLVQSAATHECKFISELSIDDETPLDLPDLPSLVIARVSHGDSLWTLAKRHRSTCALIAAANELEEGESLPTVLVIPKKR